MLCNTNTRRIPLIFLLTPDQHHWSESRGSTEHWKMAKALKRENLQQTCQQNESLFPNQHGFITETNWNTPDVRINKWCKPAPHTHNSSQCSCRTCHMLQCTISSTTYKLIFWIKIIQPTRYRLLSDMTIAGLPRCLVWCCLYSTVYRRKRPRNIQNGDNHTSDRKSDGSLNQEAQIPIRVPY